VTVTYEPTIKGTIDAEEISIGKGVVVEEGVVIRGNRGPSRRVVLGDFCYIGHNTRIIVPEFRLGGYSKLHAFSFCHGVKPMQIGRNCWIGGNTVLDSTGGLDIDDNVGIGAHSQLWTHIQFGDIVEGCRFYSRKYMHVRKDAWFVGHCIVSPVRVGQKSMALAGSVVTKDMLPNHVYAGVPATDISDKVGYQFKILSTEEKAVRLQKMVDEFFRQHPEYEGQIRVIQTWDETAEGICCFNVATRTYTQTYRQAEVEFLLAHVPLVKFTPEGKPPFVVPHPGVVLSEQLGARE